MSERTLKSQTINSRDTLINFPPTPPHADGSSLVLVVPVLRLVVGGVGLAGVGGVD